MPLGQVHGQKRRRAVPRLPCELLQRNLRVEHMLWLPRGELLSEGLLPMHGKRYGMVYGVLYYCVVCTVWCICTWCVAVVCTVRVADAS